MYNRFLIKVFCLVAYSPISLSAKFSRFKGPGPKVLKLFSSSAELSMNFQLLIDIEIVMISGKFMLKTKKLVIYPARKC